MKIKNRKRPKLQKPQKSLKGLQGLDQLETLELKKHVAVIHSNNKLTLVQRKIANALLFHAYPNLLTLDEHQIHIVKLCNLIGYDSKDYQSIKRALVNLLSTVLEWNLVDGERLDSDGVWNASAIIADASIDGPICTYSYSNKMRKLLYRPNIYGRLDMKIQAEFQSAYGLALYENCNRFQDIGKTPWFPIDKFRKLMGVEGNKYKIFRDFKTRVLDKAVEEVNKYSPLNITPQLRKIGRQVAHIQFQINPLNPKSQPQEVTIPDINHNLNNTLSSLLHIQFGFSKKQIKNIMSAYDEAYIREKINLIMASASYRDGNINNLSSYLISALKNNYQKPQLKILTSQQLQAPRQSPGQLPGQSLDQSQGQSIGQSVGQSIDTFKLQETRKREQEKLEQFKQYQNKVLFTLFQEHNNSTNPSDSAKQSNIELLNNFKKFLGRGIYQDIFSRDNFDNPLIQSQLITYLWQINHPLLALLPTYETWENNNIAEN